MLDTDAYKNYITLCKQRASINDELKFVEEEIKQMAPMLIEQLLQNDMTKVTIDGKTVHIRSQKWAKIPNKEKAIKILIQEGYSDYIKPTYNSSQVSRLLRDLDDNEQDPPASFAGVIDFTIKNTLIA
jgi:hypothetical protein